MLANYKVRTRLGQSTAPTHRVWAWYHDMEGKGNEQQLKNGSRYYWPSTNYAPTRSGKVDVATSMHIDSRLAKGRTCMVQVDALDTGIGIARPSGLWTYLNASRLSRQSK